MSRTANHISDILLLIVERPRTAIQLIEATGIDEVSLRQWLRILGRKKILAPVGVEDVDGRPGTKPNLHGLHPAFAAKVRA